MNSIYLRTIFQNKARIKKYAQPRVNQTCSAAEDAARFAKFGYNRAASGAKTQAGYAIVGRLKVMNFRYQREKVTYV